MLSSKSRITNCIILTILAFSTFATSLAYAAPLANNDKDWQFTNGNSWAWNYSPQTQINANNVQNLEVKWIFPIASKALAPAGVQALNPAEGSSTPPIVRNGVVYVTTNALTTIAIDAKTGKQLWTHNYNVNLEEAGRRLPITAISGHFHGIRYWEAKDAIILGGLVCDIYGIDAKTGKTKFSVSDLCKDIPGSIYNYRVSLAGTNNIATYEKGQQFIYNIGSADLFTGVGRALTMGVNMDTNQIMWRVFNVPPQDTPSQDWALQECDIGYFRDIPCKDVAAKARENLEWDFAPAAGAKPSPTGGATQSWGQPVVDEDTGIIYINTGNQNPWSNISTTRGPRLYGSAIMAINMNQGKRVWWQQPQPRDPYDYDCNWSGMLIDSPQIGKVYVKGCKEGYWIASDAATGKPKHIIQAFDEIYPGKRTAHITDPFDRYDMIEWKWPENSKYHGAAPVNLVPSLYHGTFATDQSYDPATGTVYHYASLMSVFLSAAPLPDNSRGGANFQNGPEGNVTIVARDLASGKIKWTWFYQLSNQRSHMVVTGDTIFSGFTDGTLKFFQKDTGKPLSSVNLGSPVVVGPTIGKDSDGNSKIFVIAGATVRAGFPAYGLGGLSAVPGTLIAVGLSDKAASGIQTTTVTTTATTTATTTSITTATTTATSSTTATTTVTTTSATTSISTTTTATTIVSTQPAQTQTTTVTSEVTQTTGLPSEVTYAAVGVAVIALIAAAVLVMRKK